MDLLFKRYASPFPFIDGMIQTGRFCEFVESLLKTHSEEREERLQWEFYLHRVLEGTFQEFQEGIETNKRNQAMSETVMETTIKDSLNILKNFTPENKGGEI